MKSLIHLLAAQPFWKGLPPQQFYELNFCSALREFRAHEKILEKGAAADCFLLLTRGEVAVETPFIPGEGVVSVQTLGPGQPLGWSWLFPPYEWHFTARAVADTEAIVFDARVLRDLARKDSAFGYELAMRVGLMLGERLQFTRARLTNLCESF